MLAVRLGTNPTRNREQSAPPPNSPGAKGTKVQTHGGWSEKAVMASADAQKETKVFDEMRPAASSEVAFHAIHAAPQSQPDHLGA